MPFHRLRFPPVLVLVCLLANACGIPRDAGGTLERIVADEVIRVGVVERRDRIVWTHGRPEGPEAERIERLAARLSAHPRWVRGGSEELFAALEERRLDLVVGGIPSNTPWAKRVALSRPTEIEGARPWPLPDRRRWVWAVPPGENGWLHRVDRYLVEIEKGGGS